MGHPIYSSPTIGSDETIYVGGDGGSLVYAVDRFGQLKWKTTEAGYNEASAAIGTNRWLYTGALNDTFGAFDPETGSNIWRTKIGSSGSPAIAQDGTASAIPPAQSGWPMYRRDAQRQARKAQCGLDRLEIASDRSALLSLRMETGLVYTLQGATDLVNWSSVTQFVTPLPAVTVRDYTASNYSSRSYRLATP